MPFTYDENGALLVTGLIGGTGNANEVAYWTSATTLSGDAGILVDAANDMFDMADGGGIGNSNASAKLEFNSAGATDYAYFSNANLGLGTATPDGTGGSVGSPLAFEIESNNTAAIELDHSDAAINSVIGQYMFSRDGDVLVTLDGRCDGAIDSGHLRIFTQPTGGALTEAVRITSTQLVGFNKTSPDRRTHATDDSASSGIIIPISRIESQVDGGAGATGHGPGLEYYGETSTTINTAMAVTASRWSVATHASRRSRFELRTYYVGNEILSAVIEAPGVSSVDGNPRGAGAVDLSGRRDAAGDVASGDYSVIGGGASIGVDGDYSVVCGGSDHTILTDYCVICGGSGNEILTGTNSVICGGNVNETTDDNDVICGGVENLCSAESATVINGYRVLSDKYGQCAHNSGYIFADYGDSQGTIQHVTSREIGTHVVNTWYPLYPDGGSTPERLTIAADSAWTVHVLLVGITQNAAQQWSYELNGIIERDNAGNTTMAAFNTTTIFESDANYDAQLAADNVNEALEVQVRRTGGNDYIIRWVATIRTSEVIYPT